ncbi:FAD-dependent oxidoreductase [Streptomyces sp. NPDC005953]|uniref:NAD(P)/FAD-dependent oxidoreductase n=1 Tax=Streptomyces sp. NPDC005953 TaxID=3156719 RepID=UPI00340837C6
MTTSTFDVVIVGNGIIGRSIAYEIARKSGDLRIAICGKKSRGGAASVAAGAMLNTFGEITKYTLMSKAGKAKFELCRTALNMWPDWLADLKAVDGNSGIDRSLTHGTTVVHNTKSGVLDDQNFAALQSALKEFDEPYEEIDPYSIIGLHPHPEARPLRAIHMPREGAIDARAILSGLERAAVSLGITALDVEVGEILTSGDHVCGVALADGARLEAETVVIAAGSFSQSFTHIFEPGAVPAIVAGRGISMMVKRLSEPGFQNTVRSPTRAGACGLHVIPLGNGIDYFGATNEVYDTPSIQADFGNSQLLMQYAREQLDLGLHLADIERWVVGNRPIAVDGFPLIGRTSVDGLILATGTYRDGFHCSPAIAQYVTEDILGTNSLSQRLPLFTPERAPIETMTVSECVREFVFQIVSGAFEAGLKLPGYHTDMRLFERHYQQAVEHYFSLLESPVALLPEMLIAILNSDQPSKHRITEYVRAARDYHAR